MSTHPTELTLEQQVEKVLLALPDDPDDIATTLEGMGIVGTPYRGDLCPIGKLLNREIPGQDLHVETAKVRHGWYSWNVLHRELRVELPANVRAFIRLFDAGKYPALFGLTDA